MESEDIETLLYNLKRVAEPLIEFHVIANSDRFESIADACLVLDLPLQNDRLSDPHRKILFGARFRSLDHKA